MSTHAPKRQVTRIGKRGNGAVHSAVHCCRDSGCKRKRCLAALDRDGSGIAVRVDQAVPKLRTGAGRDAGKKEFGIKKSRCSPLHAFGKTF